MHVQSMGFNESKGSSRLALQSGFCSMNRLEASLLIPGLDASSLQGYLFCFVLV